jgi:hypothetical protein
LVLIPRPEMTADYVRPHRELRELVLRTRVMSQSWPVRGLPERPGTVSRAKWDVVPER